MATLGIALAGAAIGGATGLGANVGFLVGSIIGRLLFPPDPVVQEGPRLGDLSVTTSTYGSAIPLGYGTIRLPGNVFWSSGIEEKKNREEISGKGGLGGPSQVNITYTYFSSFAIGFAAGPAQAVTRLWADSKLIYDIRGSTEIAEEDDNNALPLTIKPGLKFRFYPGNEEQVPDPIIESDVGEGLAPAHRGLCYIVFDRLELTDFGNRIPNITAEIAFKSEVTNFVRSSNDIPDGIHTGYLNDMVALDTRFNRIYAVDSSGNDGLRVFDVDTLNEIMQIDVTDTVGAGITSLGSLSVGKYTSSIYFNTTEGSNSRPISRLNPDTFLEEARFGVGSSSTSVTPTTCPPIYQAAEMRAYSSVGGFRDFTIFLTKLLGDSILIVDTENMDYVATDGTDVPGNIIGISTGKADIGEAVGWAATQQTLNGDLGIYKITVGYNAQYDSEEDFTTGVLFNLVDTIDASDWGGASTQAIIGPTYDPVDDSLIFVVEPTGATTKVFKWREDEGVVWLTESINASAPINDTYELTSMSDLSAGYFGFVGGGATAVSVVDTRDGFIVANAVDASSLSAEWDISTQRPHIFDSRNQSIVAVRRNTSVLNQVFLNKIAGISDSLDAIVTDITKRVGLADSEIDVTELTNNNVRGYSVTRQMQARAALEPLATAYFFDGVESDEKVVFRKRGRDPDRNIEEIDLAPLDDETNDVVVETRIQEVELPERISVAYMDYESDYQVGNQSSKRIRQPIPTMNSRSEQTISFPLVMVASEAEQLAESLLFTAWNERTTYTWRTPQENIDLDPSDVVNLDLNSVLLRNRITKADINSDFSVSFEGVSEDKVTFVSTSEADGGLGVPQKLPPAPVATRLFLFDIPLLRDIDSAGSSASRLYLGMNGYSSNWSGGRLYQGSTPNSFSFTGVKALDGVDYGFVTNKLPSTETPFQTDFDTVLRVYMQEGELNSVSQDDFLNDFNAALIGNSVSGNWELVLFKDAIEQSDGSYLVSTIMRGRRGTDYNVNLHTEGEFFIVLNTATVYTHLLSIGDLNTPYFYKGVGFNQLLEDADVRNFSSTGADLKPYSPVHIEANVDGSDNIDLNWVRRTRIGGDLQDGTGTVPVSEDSESYSVDIKDGPDGTVLRTLTSSTTSVQYDNADIVTDFGSVPSQITVEVFQISAQVGRGFGREETVSL